ncbi:MAG: glycosyltransferase family 4 protein [Actinobacteria bacterium]|nr:glycosyltransferase family 4 protein [Actinomycetota bacterium]
MAVDVTSMAGPRTGVGHVTAAIVTHLAARPDVDLLAYAVTRDRAGMGDLALPPGTPLRVTGVPARALFDAWARVPTPRIDRWIGPVDVVHGTNFVVPPTRAGALVTVHDVAFAQRPELVTPASRRYGGLLRAAVRRGAAVHVFSDVVREAIVDVLGCAPERVVRIHPGIADTTAGDPTAGKRRAGADRYVLALGTVEPRKNYPRLVAAFDRVAADDPTLTLVIAGADGWGAAALDAAIAGATHAARVTRLGYVSDADRANLLAGAIALAYPSLDEGFGHPPLEAMRAGVPVLAARAGSLPEVLGDAARLADPTAVDDLAEGLRTVVADPDTRARLVTAGAARAARYTWAATTDALVACYRTLAPSRPFATDAG